MDQGHCFFFSVKGSEGTFSTQPKDGYLLPGSSQ
jgi:hypothetical protein